MDVHDKGRLENQRWEEDVEHEVGIHAGNSSEVMEEAKLLDIAGSSKAESQTDQDDCVGDGSVLQHMTHQSYEKGRKLQSCHIIKCTSASLISGQQACLRLFFCVQTLKKPEDEVL